MTLPGVILLYNSTLKAQQLKVSIAGIHGEGNLSAKKLLNAGKIEINDNKVTIISFDMSYKKGPAYEEMTSSCQHPDDKKLSKISPMVTENSKSNAFTDTMKKAIKNDLQSGAKVYFENIEALKEDGSLIKIPGIILTIKK